MAKKKKTSSTTANKTRQTSAQPAQKQPVQTGQYKSRAAQRAAKRQARTRTWLGIVGLALVALIILLVFRLQGQNPLPAEITVQEAYQKYQEGTFLLDVREQDEWDEYHIPNTTLIPLGQLEGRVNDVPRDQEIVVVCRSGNRSQEGRNILVAAGFENVTSMSGGVNDWRQAGYPIETAFP
jgi:rhodanese-related sulfurtransferase